MKFTIVMFSTLVAASFAAAQQSVQINELVAKNETGIIDEMNEHEDWIELRNPTSAPIVVSGMYLTDNLLRPTQWRIPPGYTLQPGQTLLIWADNEPLEGPLHATFKLDNDGDDVALFDTDGTTRLDYIAFGTLRGDHSLGRMFDGQDLWVSFSRPTPNGANAPTTCGSRPYSAQLTGANDMRLDVSGSPRIATILRLTLDTAPPSAPAALLVAIAPAHFELPFTSAILVLQLPFIPLITGMTDALGKATYSIPIPDDPSLIDKNLYAQCWGVGPVSIDASNGTELRFCNRDR